MVDNTQYDDAWGTETGLVDDFVMRVDESWFATDARYNSGETLLLNWKGKIDQPIGEDGDFEYTASFPVGSGWVSNDGGVSAVSEKGRSKFNGSSIYGRIITSAMSEKGAEGNGLGIFELIKGRGRPTEAKIWTGLTFHLKQVEFNYGGEIGKKSRLMPVEFLGEGVDPASLKPTSDAAAAGQNAAAPAAAAAAATGGLEADLIALAKATDTHAAFVDKALEIPAVSEDSALLERVVDESALYAGARA